MNSAALFVFFSAVVSAWYLGYRMRKDQTSVQKASLPKDYFAGLQYLLNEEPDKAVDVFVKMLTLDSETVETHLAVSKLFRRRGEVDRAIRIHQNLIARPQLEKCYRDESLFELGQDYLSAGMLDRAERVFLEVVNIKEYTIPALKALLDVYQQEKSWNNAINTAMQLQAVTHKPMKVAIAHYYCELAERSLLNKNKEEAKEYLKEALKIDDRCARASLQLAKIKMADEDYKNALKYLKQIKSQNPDYLSESIYLLATCYQVMQDEKRLVAYLMEIVEEHPHVPVVLILSERLRQWKGEKVAANFVADYVRRYPTLRGLSQVIELYLSSVEGRAREDLLIVQGLMKKLLADKPDYQCVSCGFSGKTLHWHCPGCKQWSTLKPIHCLEC